MFSAAILFQFHLIVFIAEFRYNIRRTTRLLPQSYQVVASHQGPEQSILTIK